MVCCVCTSTTKPTKFSYQLVSISEICQAIFCCLEQDTTPYPFTNSSHSPRTHRRETTIASETKAEATPTSSSEDLNTKQEQTPPPPSEKPPPESNGSQEPPEKSPSPSSVSEKDDASSDLTKEEKKEEVAEFTDFLDFEASQPAPPPTILDSKQLEEIQRKEKEMWEAEMVRFLYGARECEGACSIIASVVAQGVLRVSTARVRVLSWCILNRVAKPYI